MGVVAINIQNKVLRSVSWLAVFKFGSQSFSWLTTLLIARILLPEDYGLMAMATVITGYAMVFSELGVGSAIIQRSNINDKDLVSIFWFSFIVSLFFALFCFVAAPITAHIFNEPRVLPLTKTVAVVFIISGLQIVPLNLLKKNLDFRTVGLIEMVGTFVACASMLLMAYYGAGVWTLVGGPIMNGFTKVFMLYYFVPWKPFLYFNFKKAFGFIRFGIVVAVSESFYYLFQKSDKFFAGRIWNNQMLGYYTMANQLALMPTEKIVSIINQVSFSAFSKLQDDKGTFNNLYLKIIESTSIIILPIYVGGFLIADELVVVLLTEKWLPITFVFKFLCLAQIPRAINAINNYIFISKGEPKVSLFINVIMAISMAISFYFAVQKGLNAMIVPWITTYAFVSFCVILFTLKKIDLNFFDYMSCFFHPVIATAAMFFIVTINKRYLHSIIINFEGDGRVISLISSIILGSLVYIGYFLLFNRRAIDMIKKLRKT